MKIITFENSINQSKPLRMKKIFLIGMFLIGALSAQAQIALGIKAGANFSDTEGTINTSMRTGFHAGAVLQLKYNNFAIQPELLYSMQGSKVTVAGVKDINLSYVTVPVLVKYYVLTDILSIDAGPQFAFLVDDNIDTPFSKSQSFDFAVVGGLGLDIGKSLFAQAHYVVGLTDASTNASIKNRVIQLSVGYKF